MPTLAAFGLSIAFSFVAWGIVAARYVWPALRRLPRSEALEPLLTLHAFRFAGLAFIVPGVVSPDLAAGFARPAAYGDFIAALLALFALAVLKTRVGLFAVWIFNVWGTADLLNAFYQGNRFGLHAGRLGAAYFIVTLIVPLLLITHGLVFRLLLQRDVAARSQLNPGRFFLSERTSRPSRACLIRTGNPSNRSMSRSNWLIVTAGLFARAAAVPGQAGSGPRRNPRAPWVKPISTPSSARRAQRAKK